LCQLDSDCDDFRRVNIDEAAVLATILEANDAVHLGEEGVILAATDVGAGLERCATLTNDNAAAEDSLAAEYLDSEPFLEEPKPFLCAIRLPLSRCPRGLCAH
jgi:hypothetical protein